MEMRRFPSNSNESFQRETTVQNGIFTFRELGQLQGK